MKLFGRAGIVLTTFLSLLLVAAGCSDDESSENGAAGNGPTPKLTLDLGSGVTMKCVRIEPGNFTIGSPETEPGQDKNEDPQRQITLTVPFYMGVTEVTRRQFAVFVADSGYETTAEKSGSAGVHKAGGPPGNVSGASWRSPGFPQTDNHPVVCVNWLDATAFCAWLKAKTGRNVSLPTEAQWVYACRAGRTTRFSFGDKDEDLRKQGNFCDRSCSLDPSWEDKDHDDGYGFTAPVGSYPANPWGLYDMHGNVSEWCRDAFAPSYAYWDERDPNGAGDKTFHVRGTVFRVYRASSWYGTPWRAVCRGFPSGSSPTWNLNDLGFRVVVLPHPG